MHQLSRATGGRTINVKSTEEIGKAFDQVLRNSVRNMCLDTFHRIFCTMDLSARFTCGLAGGVIASKREPGTTLRLNDFIPRANLNSASLNRSSVVVRGWCGCSGFAAMRILQRCDVNCVALHGANAVAIDLTWNRCREQGLSLPISVSDS
jgi:hypothetical protein